MLEFTRLPASLGTTRRMVSGRCCAGQLAESAKKATEAALDEAHKRAAQSAQADAIPYLLLVLLVLAGLLP